MGWLISLKDGRIREGWAGVGGVRRDVEEVGMKIGMGMKYRDGER